jgi:CRP/FNR family transcriptional regulator
MYSDTLFLKNYKFSKEEIEKMSSNGVIVHLRKGETLFNMGDNANEIYIIEKGSVESSCLYEDGYGFLIDILERGDFFGYSDTIENQRRSYNAVALTEAFLIKVTKAKFFELLISDQRLANTVITKMANEVRSLAIRLSNNSCLPARSVIIRDILDRMVKQDNNSMIMVPLRRVWASYLGITRETLARVLSEISKLGWIEVLDKNRIIIKELDELCSFSENDIEDFQKLQKAR